MSHHFIRFNQVHYTYPGGTEALGGVSFELKHGEKVAFVGANGAGKSTLLLLTNGLLLPTSGEINIGGIPVSKSTLSLVRQSVGLVFQNSDDQLFMPTVEEDVAFGPLAMKLPVEEVRQRVEQSLKVVGAWELRARASYQLSGGQKRCVALATVLAMQPNVLVLDEPTSNLDPRARRQLLNLLHSFSHTCMIATHDLEMAWELCSRTLIVNQGTLLADGPTRKLLVDQPLLEQAGLERPYQSFLSSSSESNVYSSFFL